VFCDWRDVDSVESGGIDMTKLKEDIEKKSFGDTSYFKQILRREFEDKDDLHKKKILDKFDLEVRLQLNKDIHDPLMPATLDHP